jgi:hypothetical protein
MNPDGNEEWEMKSSGRVGGGQLRRRGGEAGWQPRVLWVWSILLFFFDGEAKLVGFVSVICGWPRENVRFLLRWVTE